VSDPTPILGFVTDVLNSFGPYFMLGLAFGIGAPAIFLIIRLVRAGVRNWPGL